MDRQTDRLTERQQNSGCQNTPLIPYVRENLTITTADDTTLLVPEHTDITADMEFRHVKAWALTNHLTLNLDKTKEIVFKWPRAHCFHLPPAIDNIEQLDCNKLLGVFFNLISKWTRMFRTY